MTKAWALTLLLSCWGCASIAPSSGAASNGCQCPPSPAAAAAYAVTRPGACNDFPVSYRVTPPHDREGRVFAIDQPMIRSNRGWLEARPCCP